jgi:hypothetical protein
MSAVTGYFIRAWKKSVDDAHPLYARWNNAYAASEAMRMAVDAWTRQPVDRPDHDGQSPSSTV